MKILIVAPNASSRFGGEAFLPLKYFQLLRQREQHEVRLVVNGRNRDDLSALFPDAGSHIHYVADSAVNQLIWRVGHWLPRRLADAVVSAAMQTRDAWAQRKMVKQLVHSGLVDVIHQPIPVSPKAPSAQFGFGVPVVIGPMNGGMTYPRGYEDCESGLAHRLVGLARRVAVGLNWLIPGKRRAAVLLVANARTRDALPLSSHPRVEELVENGVDLAVWRTPDAPRRDRVAGRFQLAFLGRLVNWKAVDITLQAVAQARRAGHDVQLVLMGDGEERQALENLARELGIAAAVRFTGFLSQPQCAHELAQADALILNSVYECGGAVVLEAMSMGLPVIASRWGGPADYLDDTCGILVSPVPRDHFAARLAQAIATLAADASLRTRMGAAGQARVRELFDWNQKVDRILAVYERALQSQRSKENRDPTAGRSRLLG